MDDEAKPLTDQERLVQGILSSLHSALMLVAHGREHHALCIRSFSMATMYEKDWPLFYHERWLNYDNDTRSNLKVWYEWIRVTADSAESEMKDGYTSVIQRSVIFLADVLENLTESLLQVCLHYIDDRVVPIKNLTGRRPRDMGKASDIRRSVRVWERSLSHQSRSHRFAKMIRTFLPDFQISEEKLSNLDRLMQARNAYTHELIVIHPGPATAAPYAVTTSLDDAAVQSFFDDVGDYIMAAMNAFTTTVKSGLERQNGNS